MLDLTKHKIIFDPPVKMEGTATSGWIMHTPFAFFLISILKPKSFVELGVHAGISYNAFCQAVKTLKTGTCCKGIDTWKGDKHAGFYNKNVYRNVMQYQLREYSEFSQLLKMTFDHGLAFFQDKSIDLLHIDGLHSYETVRHDFESWLTKMSDKGVVLFHDTIEREKNFGVYRLWEEISPQYPSFNFTHGHGLGIVAVGSNVCREFLDFIDEANSGSFYQKLFFCLGRQHSLDTKTKEKDELESLLREREALLQQIQSGYGWRLLTGFFKARDRLFPHGTRRRAIYERVVNQGKNPDSLRKRDE